MLPGMTAKPSVSLVAVAAVMPLGRPVKQLTKLKRKPVEEFAMLERWGGGPLK